MLRSGLEAILCDIAEESFSSYCRDSACQEATEHTQEAPQQSFGDHFYKIGVPPTPLSFSQMEEYLQVSFMTRF